MSWAEDLGLMMMADVTGCTALLREKGEVTTGRGVVVRFAEGGYAVALGGDIVHRIAEPRAAVQAGLLVWLMSRHGTPADVLGVRAVVEVLGFFNAIEALRRGGPGALSA